jgi:Domain of unknown function (DUF4394)
MRTLLNRLGSHRGLSVCAAGFIATLAISTTAHAGFIWAVDNQDNLFDFNNQTPNNIMNGHTISGLATNEQILAIDFDPHGAQLYGLSSQNRLYSLNETNGVATPVTTVPFTPLMNGNHFGFDISPVSATPPSTDFGRVVSDADQNLTVNISTGLGTGDSSLSYPMGDPGYLKNPSVVALGYANDTGVLYGIDTNTDSLVTINEGTGPNTPSSGNLKTVGPLGVDATGLTGMDIATNPTGPNSGDVAFANIELPGSSVSDLYSINLTTGQATDQGRILDGVQVRDIATELGETYIVPEPASAMLLLAAGGLLAGRRRAAR